MKNFYLLLVALISFGISAQITVSPNPWSVNSETLTFTYGPDYTLWDPMGASIIYMYSGLETDGTSGTWDYHDDWNEISTLTPLTLDTATGIYTGTLEISTHDYIEDSNPDNVGPIPNGTEVSEFYFLLRNANGDQQSMDLMGTEFGFEPSTLEVQDIEVENKQSIQVVKNVLYVWDAKVKSIEIYDQNGRKVQNLYLGNSTKLPLELSNGIYFLKSDTGYRLKFRIP